MLAAPTLNILGSDRRRHWLPLALSALLHVLLALVWMGFPVPEARQEGEKTIQVELLPPAPPAPSKAADDRPRPAPQPAPATEEGQPIPQLEDGMLAQRSSRPKVKEEAPQQAQARAQPEPKPQPKPKKPEPVTQNERDFVLGQVLRHWSPPNELSAYAKADVRVTVRVGADGYFLDNYDARMPWNPAAVFDGYSALPPQDVQRRTIDAFLRAIRQAQPVRLPPRLREKAPFAVRLDFRFRDAR